ncbi:hypothetical protein BJ944DRAFT_157898 [Cunninghamella echinulata]|nr:hypothetical protein BJ944DRAFT_157898 [Cunninghamella echinulata]
MAPKGHFFAQIPQPIHNSSEINDILLGWFMNNIKIYFMMRLFNQLSIYHSCLHFFGLHLSELTIAIRVSLSLMLYKIK